MEWGPVLTMVGNLLRTVSIIVIAGVLLYEHQEVERIKLEIEKLMETVAGERGNK